MNACFRRIYVPLEELVIIWTNYGSNNWHRPLQRISNSIGLSKWTNHESDWICPQQTGDHRRRTEPVILRTVWQWSQSCKSQVMRNTGMLLGHFAFGAQGLNIKQIWNAQKIVLKAGNSLMISGPKWDLISANVLIKKKISRSLFVQCN